MRADEEKGTHGDVTVRYDVSGDNGCKKSETDLRAFFAADESPLPSKGRFLSLIVSDYRVAVVVESGGEEQA